MKCLKYYMETPTAYNRIGGMTIGIDSNISTKFLLIHIFAPDSQSGILHYVFCKSKDGKIGRIFNQF